MSFLSWSDISAEPYDMVCYEFSTMVRCKCWAGHSDLGLDIRAEEVLHGG